MRRGQGWWFAVLRSSAAAIKMCHRHLIKPICVQYGFRFFGYEKSESVSSAAKHQRGLQRGKPGSPLPCFASFCRSKRKAPAASGANYAFAKGSATPTGEKKFGIKGVAVRGCGTIFFREGIPPAGGKNWPRRASTIYGMFIDRGGAA